MTGKEGRGMTRSQLLGGRGPPTSPCPSASRLGGQPHSLSVRCPRPSAAWTVAVQAGVDSRAACMDSFWTGRWKAGGRLSGRRSRAA